MRKRVSTGLRSIGPAQLERYRADDFAMLTGVRVRRNGVHTRHPRLLILRDQILVLH